MIAAEPEPLITPTSDCPTWLALYDMGFSLIPLKPRDKTPLTGWRAYQKLRAAHSDVEAWFKATPNANIGIVTGAISGLVILDLDSADAIAEAERRGLPDTLMVRTGKGRHVYFRHPGGKIANRAGFLPGMDIRGDGGYIVGPGSIHPNGALYAWEIRVARVLRRRHRNIDLTIVADNDAKADQADNPGVEAATQAAQDNDARLAVPDCAGDANDLVQAKGLDALKAVIASAVWVGAKEPTYPEPEHDVAGARTQLAEHIAAFMVEVSAYQKALQIRLQEGKTSDAPWPIPPVLGLPVDVGLGKTSQVRDQVIAALRSGCLGRGRVVFAVPRHDLGEEQVEAFKAAGINAVLWKGRSAPDPTPENPDQRMCRDLDAQADALTAQLAVEQTACAVSRDGKDYKCPHFEVCGYQRQKRRAA